MQTVRTKPETNCDICVARLECVAGYERSEPQLHELGARTLERSTRARTYLLHGQVFYRRASLGRRLQRLQSEQLAHLRAHHFAAMCGQRRADDFVLEVQMEFAAAE